MLVAFLVLSLQISTSKESQINLDYCGYIAWGLQQPSKLIGRTLNDLHEQDNILFCKEREVIGTRN
jgi:hypothetical protein